MSEVQIDLEQKNGHEYSPLIVSNYAESQVVRVLKEDFVHLRRQFRIACGSTLMMLFCLTYLVVYLFYTTH